MAENVKQICHMLVQPLRSNNAERTWSMPVFIRGSESRYIKGKAFLSSILKNPALMRFSFDRQSFDNYKYLQPVKQCTCKIISTYRDFCSSVTHK